ncbi:hypothetical protein DSUL_100026 [Desulfovibrionales bacterium]
MAHSLLDLVIQYDQIKKLLDVAKVPVSQFPMNILFPNQTHPLPPASRRFTISCRKLK